MYKKAIALGSASAGSDFVLLVFRVYVGSFLIWGVWDNMTSAERMEEFIGFIAKSNFIYPHLMAPLTVYAQFLCGLAFIAGLFTRWAGVICAINFIVAIIMVDAQGGIRASFPSAMLVMFGFFMATYGAGRYALDALIDLK